MFNASRRADERREFLDQGVRLKAHLKMEKEKLEHIKCSKLDELARQGVPPKYLVELAMKKINV